MQRSELYRAALKPRRYCIQRSTVPRRNGSTSSTRHPVQQLTEEDVKYVEHISKSLIGYAAHGEVTGSDENRSLGYLSKMEQKERLKRTVRTAHQLPSRQAPLKDLHDQDWSGIDTDPLDLATSDIVTTPGTLVELRRNERLTRGIVIGTLEDDTVRTLCLTSHGTLLPHGEQDIMLSIPSYVDENLARRCGISSEPDATEIAARIAVLKKLREIEKATEAAYNLVHSRGQNLYETFRSPDPDQWSHLNTSTVARIVDSTPSVRLPVLFATHMFMMSQPKYFIAHPMAHRYTHTFLIRPKSKVDTIDTVIGWIRDRSDGILDNFILKATRVMDENRKLRDETLNEPPSVVQPKSTDGHTLNNNDRTIIQFLYDGFQVTRSIQQNPYSIPLSYILKRLGTPPGPGGVSKTVQQVLTNMGVLSPWENTPTIASGIEILANKPKEGAPLIRSPPTNSSLGLDDLYPTDQLESIRHDFGDMPVYVIDDATAEELDDGVSIEPIEVDPEHVWVHVHVADPTRLLPPTHRFAIHARQKAESLYLNHGTQPMFPPDSVFSTLSLGEASAAGKMEHVMTLSAKVDKDGDIVDYKVRAGIIRNVRIVTYDESDRLLGLPSSVLHYPFQANPPVSPTRPTSNFDSSDVDKLRSLFDVAERLVKRKLRLPVFSFTIPNSEITFGSKSIPASPSIATMKTFPTYRGFPEMNYGVVTRERTLTGSRMMVTELMKVASRVASRFGVDKGIPLVRRACGPALSSNPKVIERLLASRDEAGMVDIVSLLRSRIMIPRVANTIQPKGHWTLGIPEGEGYVRVTSPLRRYADLVTHWQIKHVLLNSADPSSPSSSGPLLSEDWMTGYANELTMRERETKRLYQQANAYWTAMYLYRWRHGILATDLDPSQTFLAKVISTPAIEHTTGIWRTKVIIPELGTPADIHGKVDAEIGSEFRVRFDDIALSARPQIRVVIA